MFYSLFKIMGSLNLRWYNSCIPLALGNRPSMSWGRVSWPIYCAQGKLSFNSSCTCMFQGVLRVSDHGSNVFKLKNFYRSCMLTYATSCLLMQCSSCLFFLTSRMLPLINCILQQVFLFPTVRHIIVLCTFFIQAYIYIYLYWYTMFVRI